MELAELKSGAINREARLALWRRIRREGAGGLEALTPTLVVDPDTSGPIGYFAELAEAARKSSALIPEAFDGNVTNTDKLLKEALWALCEPGSDDGDPIEVSVAVKILTRFSLGTLRAADLEDRVESYIQTLWPASQLSVYAPLLTGWLGKRATAPDASRRFFTLRELFADIGIHTLSAPFDAARLHAWQTLWAELPRIVEQRTRGQLGRSGKAVPSAEIQPVAVDALTAGSESLLIRGIGGAGKSTFLAQAVQAAKARGGVWFWCAADGVSVADIDAVADAFRFRAALAHLREPAQVACLFVDGLDEAAPSNRTRWAEQLPRLASVPGVRVIATVRSAEFRGDASLQKHLGSWRAIDLTEWPPEIVERLLSTTRHAASLPPSVLSLLRTPILLDLFWRTFIENSDADTSSADQLRSRHDLIAAFWDQRLINAPRHAEIADRVPAFLAVIGHATKSVGAFRGPKNAAAALLLSEGVLVEQGRLQSRFNFRHPLLRDFAFAQWCLAAATPREAAARWTAIAGGLQRYGALRALAEALLADGADIDYPDLKLPDVLLSLFTQQSDPTTQLAHILGSISDTTGVNPARWPAALQAALPPGFGSAVVTAAKLNQNPAWGVIAAEWSPTAPWVDETFLAELWRYTEMLLEKSLRAPTGPWRLPALAAARRLRALIDEAKFAAPLAASEQWLASGICNCVAQALPDRETLAWLERRLPAASWRVRHFILDHLSDLARTDPNRTANLFRCAIGLTFAGGQPELDAARWQSPLSDHNLHSALAGNGARPGLLAEFPAAFFPVALDLIEALFERKAAEDEPAQPIGVQSSNEAGKIGPTSIAPQPPQLIDDGPRWSYWSSLPHSDIRSRCLRMIHDKAREIQHSNPDLFYTTLAPLLRGSRSVTVQTFTLDLLLEHRAEPRSLALLREAVVDARLFTVSYVDYWLQQLLQVTWPTLDSTQHHAVQNVVADLLDNETTNRRAKRLLASLPASEWRADLAGYRPKEDTPEAKLAARPRREEDDDLAIEGKDFGCIPEPKPEFAPGLWSDQYSQAALMQLDEAREQLSKSDLQLERIRTLLPESIKNAQSVMSLLKADRSTLTEEKNAWIWEVFERILSACYKFRDAGDPSLPPRDFVRAAAEIGLAVLADIPAELPGKLPDSDMWMGYRESTWSRALGLTDEALVWEPAQNDGTLQDEFVAILRRAFATQAAMIQLFCVTRIRPYHWLRTPERRELYRSLVWESSSDPRIPQWSLGIVARAADAERTEIFRLGLGRGDLHDAKDLAGRIGDFIGHLSLLVFDTGSRSAAADLAREVAADSSKFPLLTPAEHECEFWHHFAFGLKEQASRQAARAHLASDYGQWMHAAWWAMRRRQTTNRSDTVVLFATHWMERGDRTDAQFLQPWWESIQPLLSDVVAQGSAADCFSIFFNFRDGPFNHLVAPETLLDFVDRLERRLSTGAADGQLDLDAKSADTNEHHTWRDCAHYAAEAVGSLIKVGLLDTEILRDRAHRVLSRLAADPIRSSDATKALHALQQD